MLYHQLFSLKICLRQAEKHPIIFQKYKEALEKVLIFIMLLLICLQPFGHTCVCFNAFPTLSLFLLISAEGVSVHEPCCTSERSILSSEAGPHYPTRPASCWGEPMACDESEIKSIYCDIQLDGGGEAVCSNRVKS